MKADISEFSYGFALTSELIYSPGMVITAAPVFPSLIDEGQTGGGYDVRIARPGVPLFLQFKLSECMTRRNCKEVLSGRMNVPCYRMHLRSARISRQHEMLLQLEKLGEKVYYACPAFHKPEELSTAFLGGNVREKTTWIRPSDIGALPDHREHHVSFEPGGEWTFFSDPKPLHIRREFYQVAEDLVQRINERGHEELRRERLESLAKTLEKIADNNDNIDYHDRAPVRERLRGVEPIQRVAYYSSVFLEAHLYVVHLQEASGNPGY